MYLLVAVVLAAHGAVAARLGWMFFQLPMEAGGLVLAPMLGTPLLCAGAVLVVMAVLVLATDMPPLTPLAALMVVGGFDFFMLTAGATTPWTTVGVLASAVATAGLVMRGIRAAGR